MPITSKNQKTDVVNVPRLIISGDLAIALKQYHDDNWRNQKGMIANILRRALREFLEGKGYL